ncbi:MAG: hypothetical protein JW982_08545 [Spirochaetes bacterium]|nr:hypothetical protein [Spirochaetota bacterium]
MKNIKSVRIIFSLCISLIILYQFTKIRTNFYSIEYNNRVRNQTISITKYADSLFTSSDVTNAHIKQFHDTITEKYKSIAGILFFETGNNIFSAKKDSLFYDKNDFEKFKNLYSQGDLQTGKTELKSISGKNYQYCLLKSGNFDIIIIFSYRFPFIIIAKIISEYTALFAILAVFIIIFYNRESIFIKIRNRKLTVKKSKDDQKILSENKSLESEKKPEFNPEINNVSLHTKEINVKSLESFTFEFFRKTSINFRLLRISLNIYDIQKDITLKTYETKGETFTKFSQENKSKEIQALLKELKKGAYILKNTSRSIYIPLIHNGKFLGYIDIDKNTPFTGNECSSLSDEMKTLVIKLNDHLEKK